MATSSWNKPLSPETQKKTSAEEAEWLTDGHGVFSDDNVFVSDPRDLRRAETAPSVLTMISADGKPCPSGLEIEVPPEEEYRYTEAYHQMYYSMTPRDPRMLVPLRAPSMLKRCVDASALPGRGAVGASRPPPEREADTSETRTDGNVVHEDRVSPPLKEAPKSFSNAATRDIEQNELNCMQSTGSAVAKVDSNDFRGSQSSANIQDTHFNALSSSSASTAIVKGDAVEPQVGNTGGDRDAHRQQGDPSKALASQSVSVGQLDQHDNRTVLTRNSLNIIVSPHGGEKITQKSTAEALVLLRECLDSGRPMQMCGDVKLHIVSLCKEQDGSRLVQCLLNDPKNVNLIFNELFPRVHDLITDVFGNYVLQKLLDTLPSEGDMCQQLIEQVSGKLKEYSFQMYGCRVVQKILEKALPSKRAEVFIELKDSLIDCIFDQNANHVAQKLIEVIPEKMELLMDSIMPQLKELSRHPYGCRVLQCIFEKCSTTPGVNIRPVLEAVLDHIHEYVMDQYGNYVVQHAILNSPEDIRQRFVSQLTPHVYALSCSKFASNVAEKTIIKANEEELQKILDTLTHSPGGSDDGNYIVLMVQDPYANYVVQRLLQQVTKTQQQQIADKIRPYLADMRRSVYGQHVVQKMENLGMFAYSENTKRHNTAVSYDYINPHAQNSAGRPVGRKGRVTAGVHVGNMSQPVPCGAPFGFVDHSLLPSNLYPRPAANAVTVGGQPVLPLTTTASYGYLSSGPETVIMSQHPPQLPVTSAGLAIGGQPCFPGVIAQPPQPAHGEIYSTDVLYPRGRDIMSHIPGDGFAQPFSYPQSMHPRLLYRGSAPGFYPSLPAAM
ncbi:putative Pumilio family RNA binding repeat [Trypanosoma vivax]|uniref:Putative RNA-binding regulatory protein (Pumilio family) n=1 Tax=Trypanosoma vivax (strain Y486) TaxID=1055687 RepID=G0U426_TRYVY|nr:putative Pumilio family RNA binding repeat [Trypanosoma vivax]CCC52188.1 putative RNA-binding regulatory protein (pumilio family) [Trypanosoma vivax Y486]